MAAFLAAFSLALLRFLNSLQERTMNRLASWPALSLSRAGNCFCSPSILNSPLGDHLSGNGIELEVGLISRSVGSSRNGVRNVGGGGRRHFSKGERVVDVVEVARGSDEGSETDETIGLLY